MENERLRKGMKRVWLSLSLHGLLMCKTHRMHSTISVVTGNGGCRETESDKNHSGGEQ